MVSILSIQQAQLMRLVEGSGRIVLFVAAVMLLSILSTPAQAADSKDQYTKVFDIPQQRADLSLTQFAEQADITLIFSYDLARDKTANRLVGTYRPKEAIQLLLNGTGLRPTFSKDGFINIAPEEQPVAEGDRMNEKHKKGILAALALLLAGPGLSAQGTDDGAFEEIIVKGTRLQNQRSIDAKRNTFQISDGIAADEIGRLPDFNVGESLARVPGLSIRTDQGEARFVTIRGLNPDYNSTLLDGSTIAVPDRDGRNVFMEVLPASVAKRIDVYKSLTPDLEGHAVGGIINLITPSAFDYASSVFNSHFEFGNYETNKGFEGSKPSGDADFLVADRFGSAGQFGFVFTGNYFRRDSYLPWAQFERFRFYDAAGNETSSYAPGSVAAPGQRRYHWYHNNRTRYGGMVKLEHNASNSVYNFAKLYYNVAKDDEARQTDVFANQSGNALVNATPRSGTLVGSNFQTRQYVGQFNFERSLSGLQVGSDIDLSEGTTLELRGSFSRGRFKNPESFVEWRTVSPDYAYSYERKGDAFNVTMNDPSAAYNFDNMPMYNYNFTDRDMTEDVTELSATWRGESLFGGNDLGFLAGLKVRQTKRSYDENRFEYTPTATNTFTLGSTGLASIDERVRDMPGILPGQGIISIDTSRVLSVIDDHIAANPTQWNFNDQPDRDARADYGVDEKVLAGFVAATYESDRQHLIAGVRVESTNYDTNGFRAVDGVYGRVTDSGDYLNPLPSVNYSFDMRDDLIFRAAYSRSIGRPAFGQFAPSNESASTAGTIPTVSRSNPDLKPRRSDNFDVSIERYLDNGSGIISAAIFYKRIEDEIFVRSTEKIVDVFGPPTLALVSEPENAGEVTNLYGLELNVVKDFDFLPAPLNGLGASLNVTLLNHDFKYQTSDGMLFHPKTMLGQANSVYNAALYYDYGRFSAKLAYNHTGLQMDQLNSNPDNISYVDDDWAVDFKASFSVTDRLAVTLNLYNIAGESEDLVTGRFQEQPGRESYFGSAYFVGLSYASQ